MSYVYYRAVFVTLVDGEHATPSLRREGLGEDEGALLLLTYETLTPLSPPCKGGRLVPQSLPCKGDGWCRPCMTSSFRTIGIGRFFKRNRVLAKIGRERIANGIVDQANVEHVLQVRPVNEAVGL